MTFGKYDVRWKRADRYAVTLETIQAIAEALGMTVDIIDPKLADLAPLRTLT